MAPMPDVSFALAPTRARGRSACRLRPHSPAPTTNKEAGRGASLGGILAPRIPAAPKTRDTMGPAGRVRTFGRWHQPETLVAIGIKPPSISPAALISKAEKTGRIPRPVSCDLHTIMQLGVSLQRLKSLWQFPSCAFLWCSE